MTVHPRALELIEHFEGYHRRLPDGRAAPYLCPARVPTIGIGSTFYEGGRKVSMSDPPITRERAHDLLGYELRQCEAAVDRLTTRKLPTLARGALVSFVYNVGAGAYKGSGLRRAVNAGDDKRAAVEFLKWRMGGGVVLPGLERRRRAEAALYLEGIRHEVVAGDGAAHRDGARRDLGDVVAAVVDGRATGRRGDPAGAGAPSRADAGTPAAAVAVPAQPVAGGSGDRNDAARSGWLGWLGGSRGGAGPRRQSSAGAAADLGA